ncbi:hypothetical protein [Lacipirellula parvula]|uniref:TIGR03790 family protein n=1 Tax=Lacipirellula parvula TaxID=2650471 RepID=A0A5K7XAM0_9BACT|nr:hypothetical protein [Lacipirellula parvula]BBO31356.1 hypothetical protein PLANPX_0968 [Lacipirellula parvula]
MSRRLATLLLAAVAAAALNCAIAVAGGGPQNVALLVNSNDPDSLAVANCYIELRQIPATNVVYIPWKGDDRSTSGVLFRDSIMKPALAELEQRGVLPQIDCIAFSSGFPYLIDCARMWPNEQFPKTSRPVTSLTSAAYLSQFLFAERKEMFLGNVNLYYAPTVAGKTKSRAFSASEGWGPNGPEPGGLKYYLSTALGITHGQGNTVDEVIASLRRSKGADGANYRGTIYYMANNNVRSKVRDAGYRDAVAELAALGVRGVVDQGTAPLAKLDVAGLTTGTPHLLLRDSGSTILPGALVDNLTSAGGQMMLREEVNPQTRISEFIRLGAAGASGTVCEPFALAAKFPSPALHVHYARGCSLAESYYQSVAAPCHLLIIGDPLCHPWAKTPKVSLPGFDVTTPLKGTVTLTPSAAYPDSRQASRFEAIVDGVRTATANPGQPLTIDTTKLVDGWHDLWVVAVDNTPIAVQGGWVGVVEVRNGKGSVLLSVVTPSVGIDESVVLKVTATQKGDVEVFQNSESLATVAGGEGEVSIPAKTLGRGKVKLTAIQAGTPGIRSRSLTVEIR